MGGGWRLFRLLREGKVRLCFFKVDSGWKWSYVFEDTRTRDWKFPLLEECLVWASSSTRTSEFAEFGENCVAGPASINISAKSFSFTFRDVLDESPNLFPTVPVADTTLTTLRATCFSQGPSHGREREGEEAGSPIQDVE